MGITFCAIPALPRERPRLAAFLNSVMAVFRNPTWKRHYFQHIFVEHVAHGWG
jgi:hypothetical protein